MKQDLEAEDEKTMSRHEYGLNAIPQIHALLIPEDVHQVCHAIPLAPTLHAIKPV